MMCMITPGLLSKSFLHVLHAYISGFCAASGVSTALDPELSDSSEGMRLRLGETAVLFTGVSSVSVLTSFAGGSGGLTIFSCSVGGLSGNIRPKLLSY